MKLQANGQGEGMIRSQSRTQEQLESLVAYRPGNRRCYRESNSSHKDGKEDLETGLTELNSEFGLGSERNQGWALLCGVVRHHVRRVAGACVWEEVSQEQIVVGWMSFLRLITVDTEGRTCLFPQDKVPADTLHTLEDSNTNTYSFLGGTI